MKNTKNTQSKTKKTVKPVAYTVDMTHCANEEALRLEFIFAKACNNVAINIEDLCYAMSCSSFYGMWIALMLSNLLLEPFACFTEKENWFKRAWKKVKSFFKR